MKKTVWIDLAQVNPEMDAEDLELMSMFRNRKRRCNDLMIAVTDNTPAAIIEKDKAASMVKQAQDILSAAITGSAILVGCISLTCLVSGAGALWICSTGIASSALVLSAKCSPYTFF